MAASMEGESEEKAELKSAVFVDDIRPGIEGSMCICGEGRRHQMCVIQNGTEHVYIYENTTRTGIVHLPSHCQCMCISKDTSGGEHLVCCLKDGRVIQQNLQSFREESKSKKKKKKKDKHKIKDKTRTLAADPLSRGSGDCKLCDQDIFSDLLGDAESKASSSNALPPDIKDELLDNVVILGDDNVFFSEPYVQDIILVKGCLITCAECAAGWTLSVYRQQVKCQSHHAFGKEFEFDKSPIFKTFLPGRGTESSSRHSNSLICQSKPSQQLGETNYTKTESDKQEKPQLFCVISRSMLEKDDTTMVTPSKILIIEDGLYSLLFGTDFNFLNTPIMLICLPDGRIYHSPLRTHESTFENQYKLDRTGSNWTGLQASVFFVLDQPVATIHGFNTDHTEPKQNQEKIQSASNCVCILGRLGRVVQIGEKSTTDRREKLKFTDRFIHGPVQTTCISRKLHSIIYSTGKEIYSLSCSKSSKRGASSTTMANIVSSSFVLGIGKIRALAELGGAKKDLTGSGPIVALTTSGKVLKLHPSTDGSHGNASSTITAAAAGKRMQESLQAINNISARSSELAHLGETQDQILKEMSQACHLASSLLSDHNSLQISGMFSIDVQCVFRNDGTMCNMELLCKLTNHSQWILSHGWSFTVSVDANPDWTKVDEDIKYHVTKSVPLVNFKPIKAVELIFPLQHGKISLSLPVDVQCLLHFSPKECILSLLPEKNLNTKSHINLGENVISLPIIKPIVVNLLTVLRPIQEGINVVQGNRADRSQCQTARYRGSDWLASTLQNATSLRPSANETMCSILGNTNDELVSVCMKLSSTVSVMILEHKNYGCSQTESILRWLLEDNKLVKQSTNPSRLLTPDGKVVTFQVKVLPKSSGEHKNRLSAAEGTSGTSGTSEGTSEGTREEVEVIIKAPDYLTLCQLQLAVNQRIKVVLEGEALSRGITMTQEGLQKELKKVQVLQRKLQSLQDTMMRDHSSSLQCHTNARATLELYQQLRTQLSFL